MHAFCTALLFLEVFLYRLLHCETYISLCQPAHEKEEMMPCHISQTTAFLPLSFSFWQLFPFPLLSLFLPPSHLAFACLVPCYLHVFTLDGQVDVWWWMTGQCLQPKLQFGSFCTSHPSCPPVPLFPTWEQTSPDICYCSYSLGGGRWWSSQVTVSPCLLHPPPPS